MFLILKILFDIDIEMLFYLEMLLFTGLIVIINGILLFITIMKETTKNSVGLFICTFGLSTMNIIIPLLWKGRSNPMVQELFTIFPVYNNVIWVIVLLCIGVYGIIKRKFQPLLGILCAVLIFAGQLKIGFLGAILMGVQLLIWNIVERRMEHTTCKVGTTESISSEESI